MKKAKEYIDWFYTQEDTTEATLQIITDLINEIEEIRKSRKAERDVGFVAILKEINQKWEAIARKIKEPLELFKLAVKEVMPNMAQAIIRKGHNFFE